MAPKKNKRQLEALKKASVQRLHINDFITDAEAKAPVDIYIRLPKNRRLVLWIEQGENFSKKELDKIRDHGDPYIYVIETSLFWGERPGRVTFEEIPQIDQEAFDAAEKVPSNQSSVRLEPLVSATSRIRHENPPTKDFKATHEKHESSEALPEPVVDTQASGLVKATQSGLETLFDGVEKPTRESATTQMDGKVVESRLWSLFQPVLRHEKKMGIEDFSQIGEEIIPLISDEAARFRKMIAKNDRYASQLRDSHAIYGIGTLFFLANGYTLRGILEELAYATLFMDLPLVDMGVDMADRSYAGMDALNPAEKKGVQEHPSHALKAARDKLKRASQNCLRMIEGHHEYANGAGFPRGIRSENLPPLVRILSYAVLVFEEMKKAELRGDSIDFHTAVDRANEPDKPAPARRAHATTVQTVTDFLSSKSGGQSGQAA